MGVDSSNYRFKRTESQETILRLMEKANSVAHHSQLRITITSTNKDQIQNIVKKIPLELITLGMNFSTNEVGIFGREIEANNEHIRTLSITIPYDDVKPDNDIIRLTYSRDNKDSTAYFSLNNQNSDSAINQLSKFLYAINEYSEYGFEEEQDFKSFANTIVSLNSKLSNQNKWIYKTGCITFEPLNEKRIVEEEDTYKAISGLKVQFSKIHALAYKANGSIKALREICKFYKSENAQISFTTDELSKASIIESIELDEVRCNFYFKLDSINTITELGELLENNELSIELSYAKLDEETSASFSAYLSGNSIQHLDFDLFIDIEASDEYKNRILELFENKLEYIGDG